MPRRTRHPVKRLTGTLRTMLCALALLAPQAHADPDLGQVVSRLPLSVDLAIAIDNGAQIRKELGAMPLMLTLATQPRPRAIVDAWSGLAGELGMSDAEAFDLLLGRRVVIAGAELQFGDTDEPRWALLSEIDPATERTLRDKLAAVPRRVVKGQVVSEFEHGEFLLATSSGRLKCTGAGAFENTPASTLLLLAPARDRALFEQILPLLHCNTPDSSLSQLPGGRAVAEMHARDAVFLFRIPKDGTSPDRFVAANIGIEQGQWRLDVNLSPAEGWDPDLATNPPDRWSPRLAQTLPEDPALVMIGSRNAVREARLWAMPLLGLPLPDPESAGLDSLLGARSMFAVWLRDTALRRADPEVLMASQTPNLDRLIEPADGFLQAQAIPFDGAGQVSPRHQRAVLPNELQPSEIRSLAMPTPSAAGTTDPTPSPRASPAGGCSTTSPATRPRPTPPATPPACSATSSPAATSTWASPSPGSGASVRLSSWSPTPTAPRSTS